MRFYQRTNRKTRNVADCANQGALAPGNFGLPVSILCVKENHENTIEKITVCSPATEEYPSRSQFRVSRRGYFDSAEFQSLQYVHVYHSQDR